MTPQASQVDQANMNRKPGMTGSRLRIDSWLQPMLVCGLWLGLAGTGWAQALFPQELTRFRADSRNPVLTAAGEGTWEVKIRERGFILREGDLWRLWYTGYDGTRGHPVHLGYATSRDGIQWTRHPGNPLLPDLWIEDVCVVHEGDQWYLFAEGRDDVPHWLTSADGITWTRQGDLDVRKRDGTPVPKGPLGTPFVLRTAAGWNLLYERQDAGIWLARSPDLKVWTNVSDDPVLARGPEPYDTEMIALNQVIPYRDRYYAIYHATRTPEKPRLWTTNLAVSEDLVTWKKYPGNPLFPEAENKSSGIWVHDGTQFRLYTMHEKIDVHFPLVTPPADVPPKP
jgi:predicted GH43/DUF377 family glycosyl hydrolase